MAAIPPIVLSRQAGGHVYLLAWHQMPDGWGAEIAWMEWNGLTWQGKRANVLADDLTKLPGQNYGNVPRKRVG